MRMCAHPTIFDLLFPSPFSDKKYAEKTQTEKSVKEQTQKIDSPRILSLYYYALS
jgi:hypothetical protein